MDKADAAKALNVDASHIVSIEPDPEAPTAERPIAVTLDTGSVLYLPEGPPPAPELSEARELDEMKKAELVDVAGTLGLDTAGTKAELIDRIHEYEEASR